MSDHGYASWLYYSSATDIEPEDESWEDAKDNAKSWWKENKEKDKGKKSW